MASLMNELQRKLASKGTTQATFVTPWNFWIVTEDTGVQSTLLPDAETEHDTRLDSRLSYLYMDRIRAAAETINVQPPGSDRHSLVLLMMVLCSKGVFM